jgi:hypothetical protein
LAFFFGALRRVAFFLVFFLVAFLRAAFFLRAAICVELLSAWDVPSHGMCAGNDKQHPCHSRFRLGLSRKSAQNEFETRERRARILKLIERLPHGRAESNRVGTARERFAVRFRITNARMFPGRACIDSCAAHRSCAILLNLRSGTSFQRAEFSF